MNKSENPQKKLSLPIIISLAIILASLIAYLAVSFASGRWDASWLIILGGVVVSVIVYGGFLIAKFSKQGKHLVPRLSLAISIILAFVLIFLCLITLIEVQKVWILFLIMAIAITGADTVYSYWVNAKDRLVSLVIFILIAFCLEYVVLALVELLSWHPYWIIPVVGVIIAIVIVALKYKETLLKRKNNAIEDDQTNDTEIENIEDGKIIDSEIENIEDDEIIDSVENIEIEEIKENQEE
jgi:magnesium-transporting ATPase (P-type)